jgi:hypothetical protein
MIKINRRSSFLRLLLVTALPLVLLEAGTMRAYSACVSVTGANGTTYSENVRRGHGDCDDDNRPV